jgi:hypothetical protein
MAQAITTMAAKKSTAVPGIVLLSIYGCFCFLINAQRCGVFRLRQPNSVRYMRPTGMRHRRRALNVCPRLRLQAARALLPDHSDRPLFTWSFVALEVRLFKGELALRIERHEVGPTRRKDLFHQACFRFRAEV